MVHTDAPDSVATEIRETVKRVGADLWWLLLIVGVLWLVVAVIVLRMTLTSITTVGVLIGVVFLASAGVEVLAAALRASWAWARLLLALLFVGGAIWAFVKPYDAFWSLAAAFGFLLVLKGALDVVSSVTHQGVSATWWLGLIAGLLEIGLGFWASQQYYPARAVLLVLWVGFYALLRGISEIYLAFSLRGAVKAAPR